MPRVARFFALTFLVTWGTQLPATLAKLGVLLTLGLLVYRALGGADLGRWAWIPRDPPRILALLLVPFTEEIGWRGYAQPRLQARFGALKASLVIGVFWGLWHFPMFVLQEVPPALSPLSLVYLMAGSVVFTWLCQRSGSLLPMAVAAHMGVHLDNAMASIPGTSVPFVAQAIGYVALAACLVLFDRSAFELPSVAEGAKVVRDG